MDKRHADRRREADNPAPRKVWRGKAAGSHGRNATAKGAPGPESKAPQNKAAGTDATRMTIPEQIRKATPKADAGRENRAQRGSGAVPKWRRAAGRRRNDATRWNTGRRYIVWRGGPPANAWTPPCTAGPPRKKKAEEGGAPIAEWKNVVTTPELNVKGEAGGGRVKRKPDP